MYYLVIFIAFITSTLTQAQTQPDKIVGAHWSGRSLNYDENPILLKVGQNLTIAFDNPSSQLDKAGNYNDHSCFYRIQYTIYGGAILGWNQDPFDFKNADYAPYNLRFKGSSPGLSQINFTVNHNGTKSNYSTGRYETWGDAYQVTSSNLQIIVEDEVE